MNYIFKKIALLYREENTGTSRNRLASGYAVITLVEWRGVDIFEIFLGGRNRRS